MPFIDTSIFQSKLDGKSPPGSHKLSLLLSDVRIVQFKRPSRPRIIVLGDSMACRLKNILYADIVGCQGATVQGVGRPFSEPKGDLRAPLGHWANKQGFFCEHSCLLLFIFHPHPPITIINILIKPEKSGIFRHITTFFYS
jgi:hypothetical protein